MNIKENPIAVFDSGMGGISVLRELYKLMPNENYFYYGDSKFAPYGTKSTEEIRKLTSGHIEYFISHGAKAAVIACNTATSAAAKYLRAKYKDFPIIGLEPALKPAALSSEHPTVLIMATPLTLREKKFALLMDRFNDEAKIIKLPAPDLVEFVENDLLESDKIKVYLEKLLAPYKGKVDDVVLGCTHFPFARKTIQSIMGEKVRIFDGGEGAARQTKRVLDNLDILNDSGKKGKIIFENSDESKIPLSKKLFEYRG